MIKITLKIFTILFISLNVATIAQSDFSYKKIASDNNYSESRELSISVFNNAISQYNFKKTLLPYQSIPEVTILNKDNLLLVYSQEGL
ncbi:MAG: hypothetical protein KDC67_01880, partial [Ignavibacteriae bacterium]|nr:hypothetical protein [Ignavibacteriota bacterium]